MSCDVESCDHQWSAEYKCRLCGAIRYASAPMWAACTKMKSGPRQVWLALWTFADRNTEKPRPVWPSNDLLRERCGGIGESTLLGHLATLKKLGWIRDRPGKNSRFELAWLKPYPPEFRTTPGISDPRNLGIQPPESRTSTLGISERDPRNSGTYLA